MPRNYKQKYLKSIGAGEQDVVLCENPRCRQLCEHIHHIEEKGMGGRGDDANDLENLIGLCARCHAIAHTNDGRLTKDFLKGVARHRISHWNSFSGKFSPGF